jgi:hypothetical protein
MNRTRYGKLLVLVTIFATFSTGAFARCNDELSDMINTSHAATVAQIAASQPDAEPADIAAAISAQISANNAAPAYTLCMQGDTEEHGDP